MSPLRASIRSRCTTSRHRRDDLRPQRRADTRHRGSRVHPVRRPGEGFRPRARPGVRRHGLRHLPWPHAHRPSAYALPGPAGRHGSRARGRGATDRITAGAYGMKGGLNQSLRLGQELKINPRLYQAMDMLYMPLLDLQQHLKQELLTNPFLEMAGDEEQEEEEQQASTEEGDTELESSLEAPVAESPADTDRETNWEDILLDGFGSSGGMSEQGDDREPYEAMSVSTRHLDDHLLEQIKLLELTPRP